jgi:aldehyde:ferredoxin oxidoreductase
VTGWDLTREEIVTAAHRGLAMAKLLNMREGLGRESDALPKRFQQDLPKHKGISPEMQDQVRNCIGSEDRANQNPLIDCSPDGVPPRFSEQ